MRDPLGPPDVFFTTLEYCAALVGLGMGGVAWTLCSVLEEEEEEVEEEAAGVLTALAGAGFDLALRSCNCH